jgi:hypothetical protein
VSRQCPSSCHQSPPLQGAARGRGGAVRICRCRGRARAAADRATQSGRGGQLVPSSVMWPAGDSALEPLAIAARGERHCDHRRSTQAPEYDARSRHGQARRRQRTTVLRTTTPFSVSVVLPSHSRPLVATRVAAAPASARKPPRKRRRGQWHPRPLLVGAPAAARTTSPPRRGQTRSHCRRHRAAREEHTKPRGRGFRSQAATEPPPTLFHARDQKENPHPPFFSYGKGWGVCGGCVCCTSVPAAVRTRSQCLRLCLPSVCAGVCPPRAGAAGTRRAARARPVLSLGDPRPGPRRPPSPNKRAPWWSRKPQGAGGHNVVYPYRTIGHGCR